MFRQLFLEDKNHHSVGEVSQESHFKAFEEVSIAQLLRLPESGECPHLLSTSLVHGDGLEGVHGLGDHFVIVGVIFLARLLNKHANQLDAIFIAIPATNLSNATYLLPMMVVMVTMVVRLVC